MVLDGVHCCMKLCETVEVIIMIIVSIIRYFLILEDCTILQSI